MLCYEFSMMNTTDSFKGTLLLSILSWWQITTCVNIFVKILHWL